MSIIRNGRRALACLALLAAGSAHASSLTYTSPAGEPLAGGVGTRTLASPAATFTATSNPYYVSLDVDVAGEHWNLQFAGPQIHTQYQALHRGSYPDAEPAGFATAHAPGIEFHGPQGDCADPYGSFKIRQVDFDFSGDLEKLEATFVHRCGSATAPALTGTIVFNAKPRSYSYTRDAGSPLGTGTSKTSYGDTTDISAGGMTGQMDWDVSGQRDHWHFVATPPTGKFFAKNKSYALAASADATHAGLEVTWNDQTTCTVSGGTLKVKDLLTFEGMGEVAGLFANYTIQCNGGTANYQGTVRYEL